MVYKKRLFILSLLVVGVLFFISLSKTIYFEKEAKEEEEIILKVNTLVSSGEANEIDFLELEKTNKDTVGWLKVLGSKVDYPIVQGSDNQFYLNHNFSRNYNVNGWVFVDYRNNLLKNKNTLIYAHGISKKALFGSLLDFYDSKEWFQDKTKHYIYLETKDASYTFQIFSLYKIKTTTDYLAIDFTSNSQYDDFLEMVKKRSYYDFSVNLSSIDKIITLSTCYNKKEKLVIHGKLI